MIDTTGTSDFIRYGSGSIDEGVWDVDSNSNPILSSWSPSLALYIQYNGTSGLNLNHGGGDIQANAANFTTTGWVYVDTWQETGYLPVCLKAEVTATAPIAQPVTICLKSPKKFVVSPPA